MKNVLNYFVRKAFGFKSTATAEDKTLFGHLLRIRQNIQGVYDWLYGRLSAEHLPKRMPMTEAVTSADGHEVHIAKAWNSDNLLAHLRLLDGRKISNGYSDGTPADDGLPDGVSLARLLCDSSLQPTELIDDNVGWVMDKTPTLPSTLTKLVLNCISIDGVSTALPTTINNIEFPSLVNFSCAANARPLFIYNNPNITELTFPEVKAMDFGFSYDYAASGSCISTCSNLKKVSMPKLESFGVDINGVTSSNSGSAYCCLIHSCENLEEVYLPSYTGYRNWRIVRNTPNLKKLVLGYITSGVPALYDSTAYPFDSCTNLLHLEIQGASVSLDFRSWSPTLDSSNLSLFLDNFLHFIAERVAQGKFTLTLSAAVYAALEQQEGQTILALLNTKGWTVASA